MQDMMELKVVVTETNGKATRLNPVIAQEKNLATRSHRLAIYVPSVSGQDLVSRRLIEFALVRCRDWIIDLCGGCTKWNSLGSWLSRGEPIQERVTLICAWFQGNDESIALRFFDLCRWLKETLRQDYIAVELDFQFYLI